MAFVDDDRGLLDVGSASYQPVSDILDRLLGRGEPDPLQPLARHVIESFEGQRQVSAAPSLDHGMDLVDDDGARGPQHVAAALGGKEQVQRLGRGDQNVRRGPKHRGPLGGRRIAGAHRGRDVGRPKALGFRQAADLPARLGQILVDVRAQGLERGDVQHLDFVGQRSFERPAEERIQRNQEGRERLA